MNASCDSAAEPLTEPWPPTGPMLLRLDDVRRIRIDRANTRYHGFNRHNVKESYCMGRQRALANLNGAWESICEGVGESSDSAIVIESVKAVRLPIGLQIRTARDAVVCLKGRGVESTITPDAPVSVEEAVVETHEGTRLPDNIGIPREYANIRDRLRSTMQYTTGSGESRTWIKEVPFAARTDSPPVLVTLCELCSSVEMTCAVWRTSSLAAVPKLRNHRTQSYAQHAESNMHLQALRRFTCKESPGALDSYTSLPPPSRTSSVPLVDLSRDLDCEDDVLGRQVFYGYPRSSTRALLQIGV